MKKLFTITITLVAFAVNAQNITIGAKSGLNFAGITGENADELRPSGRTSIHIGGTLEVEIFDSFSIQAELLYSGQGYSVELGGGDYKVKLDYINLPLLLRYHVEDDLFVEVGPQVGFLISAKSFYSPPDSPDINTDIRDMMNVTDIGLNLGVGYKLDSGLNFGIRYSRGITNTYDGLDGFKNSVLQLSVGFNLISF